MRDGIPGKPVREGRRAEPDGIVQSARDDGGGDAREEAGGKSPGSAYSRECGRGAGGVRGGRGDSGGDRDAGGHAFGQCDGVRGVWREGGEAERIDFRLREICGRA